MNIPTFFRSWYFAGSVASLARGPLHRTLGGKEMAIFRTRSGKVVAIGARCPHMNANLALGHVYGEELQCPLHGWRFGADGRHCPRKGMEPACASAATDSFPVEVRHGNVFVFNHATADFPLPCFDGLSPTDLTSSTAHQVVLDVPWYLISGNFIDEHHFQAAHDRRIVEEIASEYPDEHSFRIRTSFLRTGDSLLEKLLVTTSGARITMRHRQWRGNFACTEARTSRVLSYGMIILNPLSAHSTELTFFGLARTAATSFGRLFDPLRTLVRKKLIVRFLSEDWQVLEGVRFIDTYGLAADNRLREYLEWLGRVCKE